MAFTKSISEGVNIYCLCPGDAVSTFLARDAASPCVDNRLPSIGSAEEGPLLVPGKPEVR